MDSRTDGQEAYISKEFHCGIWIDIFPLDGVPEDAAQRNAFIAAQQAAIKQLSNADRAVVFTPNPLKLAKRIWISLRYRHMDYRKLTASLDENARKYSYEDSKLIGVTVFCGGHNNVIEKAGFEDAALLPFEGRSFKVPGTYREYLAHLFGPDYMTPPPERKRFQQHYYSCWWKDSAQ